MSQNRSSAVMQQRNMGWSESLDYFPTPPWATRALCEWIGRKCGAEWIAKECVAWEPAAGQHHMARALGEYFAQVFTSDIANYPGVTHDRTFNFLSEIEGGLRPVERPDWIITNPPFNIADDFVLMALDRADYVAVLVRTAFLEGVGRHRDLFSKHPPEAILQFSERVPMVKGRVSKKATTATSYCWVVFSRFSTRETRFEWIKPCRKRLEKEGDYDEGNS
jgi:hypothetical protein